MLCLVLTLCITGCGDKKESDVPQPNMAMKTVTQNSNEDYVTFEFQLPEDWICVPNYQYELAVVAGPESAAGKTLGIMEQLPYKVDIGNYYYSYYSTGTPIPEDIKKMYDDLLSESPETYKAYINRPPYTLNGDENSSPPYGNDYITDFQYQLHNGKNGKIAEVQYKLKLDNTQYHVIECYCEKLPYRVSGTFDNSLELSSGEVALWVADSLEITEHFTLKDGKIEKKG